MGIKTKTKNKFRNKKRTDFIFDLNKCTVNPTPNWISVLYLTNKMQLSFPMTPESRSYHTPLSLCADRDLGLANIKSSGL